MNKEELEKILENHKLWLVSGGMEGERADLRGADLTGADLREADLREADLIGADLSNADLRRANLYGANLVSTNLVGTNLSYASLVGAILIGANLVSTNLVGADLSGADLREADLNGVNYNENTAFFALQCPEEGSFIGWKKCRNDVIVKLLIPEDALRSSATSRKCRASKVKVLEIIGDTVAQSKYDITFTYKVGEIKEVKDFDDDRWNDCSHGIHFFITRKEAENYYY